MSTASPVLAGLVDEAAVWVAVGQRRLTRLLQPLGARPEFGLDLTDPARLWFDPAGPVGVSGADGASGPRPSRGPQFRPHLIASVAPGPATVRWAWALEGLAELPSARTSTRLTELGRARGLPALTEPEVASTSLVPDGDPQPSDLARRIGLLACLAVGEVPYHVFAAGAGTLGVVLVQAPPGWSWPPLLAEDLVDAVEDCLAVGELTDHRRAVWAVTQRLGWPCDTRDPHRWWVRAPGRPVLVELDADARILRVALA